MTPPTAEELLDAIDLEGDDDTDLRRVDRMSTPWRHGTSETSVFRRESDQTFWQAVYQRSSDGETHGLRDGHATIIQVFPHQVTTTVYRPAPAV